MGQHQKTTPVFSQRRAVSDDGKHVDTSKLTLSQALDVFDSERLSEHNYKPRTIVEYERTLDRLHRSLGDRIVASLRPNDVQGFLSSVPPGSLPSTYSTVAAVLRWLDAYGFVGLAALVPRRRPRRPGRTRYLTDAEYHRLWSGLHDRAVIRGAWPATVAAMRFVVLVPLRRSELVSLAWREVDVPGRRLFLFDTKTGDRCLPLPRTAATILLGLPQSHHYVFPGRGGRGHLSDTSLGHAFDRVCTRIGLNRKGTPRSQRVSLHTLRHSWGSKAARDGVPSRLIQLMLGHSTPYMTTKCAHVTCIELEAWADRFDRDVAGSYQLGLPLPVEGGSR